jgi:hypothetical protein
MPVFLQARAALRSASLDLLVSDDEADRQLGGLVFDALTARDKGPLLFAGIARAVVRPALSEKGRRAFFNACGDLWAARKGKKSAPATVSRAKRRKSAERFRRAA